MRVGFGYDIHPFREDGGGQLRLGGIEIAEAPQLKGHSDGDSLIHAVIDALLGAAGEGDIGQHFPPGEPQTADIDSRELLQRVERLLSSRNMQVVNVDVTVIAERPRLAEYITAMRESIAGVLNLAASAVNVKATTNEGMGVIGNGAAIAAMAVALVEERVR
jgi:2-C-methyl-D-erythritol 2,4-cyclodiphosphate synthase